ncbi:MAG: RNA-binding S4 domain-containing protein [Bacteroidaceae bacterium]|nr:RNA-binding S4 domain-containing protein [Bacteroidaceae bacterium]
MSTEDELWRAKFSNPEGGSRDGYRPSPQDSKRTSGTGRPMRPRITTRASVYSSSNVSGEQRPRRPRIAAGSSNDYGRTPAARTNAPVRREGSAPRREGGYSARPFGGDNTRSFRKEGTAPRKPMQGKGPRRPRTADYNPNAKYSMKKQIEYKETHIDPNEPIRLNRFLANAGVCSRREADDFIAAGVVSVNGKVVTELGTKVLRSDNVVFHNQPVMPEKKVYILLNKPKDYVTTTDDPQKRKTVMDLIKGACREHVYPVGRLDRNTTGVLLFTNDGDLASKLTHPHFLKKKVYHVFLDKNVAASDIQRIAEGIELDDGEIHADAVEYASPTDKKQVGIEIHSGRNRIVRRIFEHLGYRVVKLDRVLFAGLTKKNVKRGDWRFLTEAEVNMLRMGAFE